MDTTEVIGFCTECGASVTEATLGLKEPKIICKKCMDANARGEKATRSRMRARRNASIITGLIVGGALLAFYLGMFGDGPGIAVDIGVSIWIAYSAFAFTAQMFFDGAVRNVLFDIAEKSIHLPGLIFEWSFDGIIWLIGMKILFWLLGVIAGILFAILGFFIALIIAPFVYPFSLVRQNADIKNADDSDFI